MLNNGEDECISKTKSKTCDCREQSESAEVEDVDPGTEDLIKDIRQEMTLFENKGIPGRYLQLVYDYIMSVPSTSVEAEQAFSADSIICFILQTRLSDKTLVSLCFYCIQTDHH